MLNIFANMGILPQTHQVDILTPPPVEILTPTPVDHVILEDLDALETGHAVYALCSCVFCCPAKNHVLFRPAGLGLARDHLRERCRRARALLIHLTHNALQGLCVFLFVSCWWGK